MSQITDLSIRKRDEKIGFLTPASLHSALRRWEELLESADTFGKLLDIRNSAYVVEKLFEDEEDSEMLVETACKLKLRAEYRLGKLLTEISTDNGVGDSKNLVPAKEITQKPQKNKLNDYGFSKEMAKAWQKMATLPEKKLQSYLATYRDMQKRYKKPGLKGFFKYAGLGHPKPIEETDSLMSKRIKIRHSSISRLLSRVIDLESEVRMLRMIVDRFPPEQLDEVVDSILGIQ